METVVEWNTLEIAVRVTRTGNCVHIQWDYLPERLHGGYVSLDYGADFATVETDSYEGSAHFPNALLPEVIKQLALIAPWTPQS